MVFLILGVLLWAAVHFLPTLARPMRQSMIDSIGENGYKGVFSLLMLGAIALIVFGWRSIEHPAYLYHLPLWTRHLGMLMVLLGFIMMGASNYNTRIRQFVRHPQLTGFTVWAIAHLLMNGDSRSLVLFGGLGTWAVLEIIFINRREGPWEKPGIPSWGQEFKGLVISLLVFAAFFFAHPWLAGVAIR